MTANSGVTGKTTAEELHKANRKLWADRGHTQTVINFPSAKPGGDGA